MYINLWSELAVFMNSAGGYVCDYQRLSSNHKAEWDELCSEFFGGVILDFLKKAKEYVNGHENKVLSNDFFDSLKGAEKKETGEINQANFLYKDLYLNFFGVMKKAGGKGVEYLSSAHIKEVDTIFRKFFNQFLSDI